MGSFQRIVFHTQIIKSCERSFIENFIFPFLKLRNCCLSFAVSYQDKVIAASVTSHFSLVIKLSDFFIFFVCVKQPQ